MDGFAKPDGLKVERSSLPRISTFVPRPRRISSIEDPTTRDAAGRSCHVSGSGVFAVRSIERAKECQRHDERP